MEKHENCWKTLQSGLINRLFEICPAKLFVFPHLSFLSRLGILSGRVIEIAIGQMSLNRQQDRTLKISPKRNKAKQLRRNKAKQYSRKFVGKFFSSS